MKKTITKPDGTHEVVEGTAEEIAEYERKVKQEPIREEPKKPGLLTDDTKHLGGIDWQKVLEEVRKSPPVQIPGLQWVPNHSPFCELKVAERGWMSIIPPRCTCGAQPWDQYNPWYTITCSSTITLTCPDCGMPTAGSNSSPLCNCARGADGKVLEESNVEARAQYRELQDRFFDITKYKITSNYTSHSSLGKFF